MNNGNAQTEPVAAAPQMDCNRLTQFPAMDQTETASTAQVVDEINERLVQARAGSAQAFCDLCEEHEGRLIRQASALSGNHATAEDLAQETLLAAWKSISRFRGQCRFFTWLCGILINTHKNSLRKKRPLSFSALPPARTIEAKTFLQSAAEAGVTPDQHLHLAERQILLRSCLERLPRKQREVVYLRFYVDSSLEGIAAALGCSIGTVKSRLFHGLEKLSLMQEIKKLKDPV